MGPADTRKQQHDRSIRHCEQQLITGAWAKGKKPSGHLQWHEFAARHGGVGAWIDMPVNVWKQGENIHKSEVNRSERV